MQKMPEALGALEDGSLGAGHADVLANQADRLSGREKKAFEEQSDQLVADAVAEGLSVREFERRCRERVDRLMGDDGVGELEKQRRNTRAWKFTDPITGMKGIHGEWDPLRGEAVHRALDAEIAARVAAGAKAITDRQRAQVAAEALHALICGKRLSRVEAGGVMVLIDYDALVDGHATAPDGQRRTAETHRGTPLPVETIRRIACDAGIIPIVLGGDGQALDVGRERRLATRAQRMALRAQYPTCAMDPAHAPRSRCRASHHREGTTLTERAVGADQRTRQRRPLTMTRPPHEGGWTLTRNQDGTWHMHPPQKPPP